MVVLVVWVLRGGAGEGLESGDFAGDALAGAGEDVGDCGPLASLMWPLWAWVMNLTLGGGGGVDFREDGLGGAVFVAIVVSFQQRWWPS